MAKTEDGAGIKPGEQIQRIPLERLKSSKHNRRVVEGSYDELVASLAANGQLTPAIVRKAGDAYEVGAGNRRLMAATDLGWKTLDCVVREYTDAQFLELVIVENLQRLNLKPLEEADLYAQLLKQYGNDRRKIAARTGQDYDRVRDRLQLLKLIPEARRLFEADAFTLEHAIKLSRLSPADQARPLGTEKNRIGHGLFVADHSDSLGLDGKPVDEADRYKAASPREFQSWIDKHCRFDSRSELVSELLPATDRALKAASEQRQKVVQITLEHSVEPSVKAAGTGRIYGPRSWWRADGTKGHASCPSAAIGVVVIGPHNGESFPVCVDRECKVHKRPAARRTVGGNAKAEAAAAEAERQRREAEQAAERRRKQWAERRPQLIAAIGKHVHTMSTGSAGHLGELILSRCGSYNGQKPDFKIGKDADAVVRFAGASILINEATEWQAHEQFPAIAKRIGLDLKTVFGAPAPTKAAKPKAKKATKGKRR